ncbi:MAG: SemiSWEET family sugar transporter [Hyphomonas sp.]
MLEPIEMLGMFAGIFGTFAALPQAVKIVRTRSAGDISLTMFLMALTGAILWGIYGWLSAAPSIVFWNIVAVIQMSIIIGLKLRHS